MSLSMQGIRAMVRFCIDFHAFLLLNGLIVHIGMARIMTCSRGLAHAILNPSAPFTFEETGVPECFEPTKERLAMSKVSVEDMWREVGKGKREMMH